MKSADFYNFLNWADYIQHEPMILFLTKYFFVTNQSPTNALQLSFKLQDIGKFTTFELAFKYIYMTTFIYNDAGLMPIQMVTCNHESLSTAVAGCKRFRQKLQMQPQQQIFNLQAQQVTSAMEWKLPRSDIDVPSDPIFLHKMNMLTFDLQRNEPKKCVVLQVNNYYFNLYAYGMNPFYINLDVFELSTLTQSGRSWQREFGITNGYIEANPSEMVTFFVYNAIKFIKSIPYHYNQTDESRSRVVINDLNQLPCTIIFFENRRIKDSAIFEAKLNFNIFYSAFGDRLKSLQYLHLQKMSLTGNIDSEQLPPNLKSLMLDSNELYGSIDWCKLPRTLEYISVMFNQLEGEIDRKCLPPSLSNMLIQGNKNFTVINH